jgi:hypothetical protein
MFYSFSVNIENSIFSNLKNSFEYEPITKGRYGTNLVYVSDKKVPLVRTTTKYQKPAHIYNANKHVLEIIRQINHFQNVDFNNALIEVYNNEYKTMGFHSDQTLDLADDSFIAIFSCYSNPDTKNKRQLVIQDKENACYIPPIDLNHNSVVLFSTDTNRKYLHKIVLQQQNQENTEWLGITFRLSKTFIQFRDGIPFFENGSPLTLCALDQQQSKEFYRNRSLENKSSNYTYEPIFYTISPSDLLEPVKCQNMTENKLLVQKNLLVFDIDSKSDDLTFLFENFCGRVLYYSHVDKESDILIYMVGNVSKILATIKEKCHNCRLYAVNPFSHNMAAQIDVVNHGFVPINVCNLGIYFREMFTDSLFEKIFQQHRFSELTESNKPTNAFRKGVYLSNVKQHSDTLEFNLLRCSTNFQFPTENFRDVDHEIIRTLNDICQYYFEKPFDFNHVLAQIYENKMVETRGKKARISAHSDKTKDMPPEALMAFCTFYTDLNKIGVKKCGFDYLYKSSSTLTKLVFHKKRLAENSIDRFELSLYPNSVFVVPLSTNRLFTHAIVPSILDIEYLPTRMGYVVRCSKTKCVHNDGKNFVVDSIGDLVEMTEMTDPEFLELKRLYFVENTSDDFIEYPFFHSSMNHGDYLQPII